MVFNDIDMLQNFEVCVRFQKEPGLYRTTVETGKKN